MNKPTYKDLLDAGCHFGHLKRKWNPQMLPYIFMERKGIHIIDLNRTLDCMEVAAKAMKSIAKSGRKILFVGTKKQSREIIQNAAKSIGMPYVTDRWLGGMLTNFTTIRKSIKKMQNINRMLNDGTLESVTKKEKLMMSRKRDKLEKLFGGIEQLNRLPSAIFLVDIHHEHIALAEAKRLGMKTFGIVDTNSNPLLVDFAVPANDDASKSIAIITNYIVEAIKEGLADRKATKGDESENEVEAVAEA
jgi:small subunit ribosomal protein S2